MPRIAVISLGGTIASVSSAGSGSAGVAPRLGAEQLVAAIPQLPEVADITAVSFRQLPSPELKIEDLLGLAAEIGRRFKEGADGVVVTQGTDTLEETAFALDLLVAGPRPVVVTGAMRNPSLPGADGPANLLAAAQVAASREARGLGTLVVFNDEVHAARHVRKTHTQNLGTFKSGVTGPIGWLAEGRVRIVSHPLGRHHLDVPAGASVPPVALLTVALGDDARLLGALQPVGYAGLVVEATGGGHVPGLHAERLGELVAQMPVVLASRTGTGEMLGGTYEFVGSEIDLLRRGLISAGVLDGLKARLLLSLLLTAAAPRDAILNAFAAVGVPTSIE